MYVAILVNTLQEFPVPYFLIIQSVVCWPISMASFQSLLEMQSPMLELLSQNLCFSKITRGFVYSVAFVPLDLRIGLLAKVY